MDNIEKYLWIDEFITNVKPYIFVRAEDNLLIKRPNKATKINSTGVKILSFLLNGGSIEQLLKTAGNDKQEQIISFILAIKGYLENMLDEFSLNQSVVKKPFEMKFSDFPVLSELALTYRCNLKCRFCYAGCNTTCNPINSSNELEYEELRRIIDVIRQDAKVPSISFTGGEPTLRRDVLLKLITYARGQDFRVNLITNGTLIDKAYALELKEAGLHSAQVSLEGVGAEIHDSIVAMKGAFEKSVKAIRELTNVDIFTHSHTTISRPNLGDVLKFPVFVKDVLKLPRFSMNLLIPTGSFMANRGDIVPYSEIGSHLKQILQLSKENEVEFMWYSPVPMCMFNSITHGLGNKGCAACDGLISVAPNGDVLPCASYDEPVGNILEQPFDQVWHSKKARAFRNKDKAPEVCKKCADFAVCNGACPLYWRDQGEGELDEISIKQYHYAGNP